MINEAIAAAKSAGALVVYTQDWHPRVDAPLRRRTAASGRSTASPGRGARSCTRTSIADADAPRVRKGTNGEDGYSGFTMRDPVTGETKPTELEGLLRERGIDHVVVCGLATDYCVNATALDAIRLGFDTYFLEDGVRRGRPERGRRRAGDRRDAQRRLPALA